MLSTACLDTEHPQSGGWGRGERELEGGREGGSRGSHYRDTSRVSTLRYATYCVGSMSRGAMQTLRLRRRRRHAHVTRSEINDLVLVFECLIFFKKMLHSRLLPSPGSRCVFPSELVSVSQRVKKHLHLSDAPASQGLTRAGSGDWGGSTRRRRRRRRPGRRQGERACSAPLSRRVPAKTDYSSWQRAKDQPPFTPQQHLH